MPGGAFWVGVTEDQAAEVGALLLTDNKAEQDQAREALFEVLRSSIDAAVRIVAPKFQLGNAQKIALKTFDAAEANCFTPVRFSASGVQFEIYVGISPQLRQLMEQRAAQSSAVPSALDQLFDFELPVSFSFGRKKLALKDVLKLAPSSVVELDRAPNDLVEVIVNDSVIAWGEVVSIDGQYGIRIRRIAPGGLRTSAMSSPPRAQPFGPWRRPRRKGRIRMQDLITYGMLAFLGLGVIGLCASLVQLLRASIRTRPARDPVKFREMVTSTRSALMELQTMLSSELTETTARQIASVTQLGRPEVELFQKIRKYQSSRPEAAWGGQH